jgi:small subunit ribosomal protein S4e
VITIEKSGEYFRLLYDVKGRFAIHRITEEEARCQSEISELPSLL